MKLTTITTILALEPIPKADRIERATVLGWSVVVRKGLHQVGDKVVFVFPDTMVPRNFLEETYVGADKVRLKTVRMRGQFSAGLVLPLSILGTGAAYILDEGDDVSEVLGVTKYEKELHASLSAEALGKFPTQYVPKTDEDNYRSCPAAMAEARAWGKEMYATLKLDGTSCTYIFDKKEGILRACSRNLELRPNDTSAFWLIAKERNLEAQLRVMDLSVALQGEICGPRIQGNPLKLTKPTFFLFLVKDLETNRWMPWHQAKHLAVALGVEHVPQLAGLCDQGQFPTNEELQAYANKLRYSSGELAEGMVLRTAEPTSSDVLGKAWWSVKVMSEPYDAQNKPEDADEPGV